MRQSFLQTHSFSVKTKVSGNTVRAGLLLCALIVTAGCQTTRERQTESLPAHPTEPVQAAQLPAPEPEVYVAAIEQPLNAQAGTVAGPVSITPPETTAGALQSATLTTTSASTSSTASEGYVAQAAASDTTRWEFLNWFGGSNAARRAPNPAARLRTSRELDIGDADAVASAQQYPVAIGENSRLVPT